MRIAIVHKDRCHAKKCGTECIIYCPRYAPVTKLLSSVRMARRLFQKRLCVGCGICIKKCPFEAIDIVSLPEELEHPTHRYGKNGFALYGLPIPVAGKVTGILGANGIGKSTAVKILSGQLRPNLGNLDTEVAWEEILKRYRDRLFDYLQSVQRRAKRSRSSRSISIIYRSFSRTIRELLKTTDERGRLAELIPVLKLEALLDHAIGTVSGGNSSG